MEKELDLTLKLGLSTSTTTDDKGTNVVDGGQRDNNNDGGVDVFNRRRDLWGDDEVVDDEGARNNMDINLRVYNYVFKLFAGLPNTLNFDPYPIQPSPAATVSAPMTPHVSDQYVLIDVPAGRARRNNARNAKRLRGGCGGGRFERMRKCTNLNCNALSTPMWRSGPLGPKSLCNACGIKFRKEQEKKKSNIN